jgi:hypothetical protein
MLGHCLAHHGAEDFGREFPGFEELFRKIIQESKIDEIVRSRHSRAGGNPE